MSQMSFILPTQWTVTDLTRYIRQLMEGDESLQDLWVQGEVSNLSRPTSGHIYFTLKDASAALRCVMWRNTAIRQPFLPHEGELINAHGAISIYEASGQYQLYVDILQPAGEGALFQEFLRRKTRLETEGLFDEERKRAIPKWPHRIGIVTSPTGAALRDMLDTIRRRFPLIEVILAATQVQGEGAPAGIVAALQSLNEKVKPDIILLARGGGSIEDLWAFNDESVARAIVASQAPVITGVGHETDFTIADFAADLRAPTPTAAAELATPNKADLLTALTEQARRAQRAMASALNSYRWELRTVDNRLGLFSPRTRIRGARQRVDELAHRAGAALAHRLRLQRAQLEGLQLQLAALNPLEILGRGYAMVSQQDGRLVRSVQQVHARESLNVRVRDGEFGVQVTDDKRGDG